MKPFRNKRARIAFVRPVAIITLICFVFPLSGCRTTEEIPADKARQQQGINISQVVKWDGTVVKFREVSGRGGAIRDTVVVGVLDDMTSVAIPLSQIQRVYVDKADPVRTVFAAVGITVLVLGVAFLIALATKESCPFVYSYDGERFVFDGEPYGGAICQGLARADWCRLDHLRAVAGEYRLLLTNEVDETQFTDEVKLWVVDHAPATRVCPDAEGNLSSVGEPIKPLGVTDSRGNDLSRWLMERDMVYWEANLSQRNPDSPADLRDSIVLTFPRPAGVTRGRLLADVGTTMWGSQMLKRMAELQGEQLPQWYDELKDPTNRQLLDLWDQRQELYKMQVRILAGGTWQTRGLLWGGGPFVTEERAVELDLSGTEGDTLRLLLTPAAGFWQLNSFAVDYSRLPSPQYLEISATSVLGDDGADLTTILSATDGEYYVAPQSGQTATLVFPAPPFASGRERTIFAKVSGYYDLRARAEGIARTDILDRIIFERDYPARFALQEFLRWKSEILGAARGGEE